MCELCQRLNELYAETQLECLRQDKMITRVMIKCCKKCEEKIFIAEEIKDREMLMIDERFRAKKLSELLEEV